MAGFAIAIAIPVVVTAAPGVGEARARGAFTLGGLNVRPQKVEGVDGERDGLRDAILDDDLVIEAVSDLGDGPVVRDGETEVHVGKVEGPDLVASVGVFEVEPDPVGETMPKQFIVAHSVGGGDSGNLVTGLSTIVEEHGEGEVEGRRVVIVERVRVVQSHLDGAGGRHLGRFRPALAAELVKKRLLLPGGAALRGARPRRKRCQGSRGRVGGWRSRSQTCQGLSAGRVCSGGLL